ncbi:prion-inhibition and propagation-domain-containing protein, partial [Leptodontidium sp. 2 PMI_412]
MAELVGTVFGVVGAVGVLGQIFDGCIKAYSFFTSASNLGRDSERLVCKIRIEEMRLLVWGREWGVIEGRLEEYLVKESQMGNERLRGLALDILVELHRSISDFGRLKERYGLREEGGDGSQRALAGKKDGGTGVAGRLRNELQLRAKWVIADKEKFTVLLRDLKDYNDGLEQLFPPGRLATLHRTWTNELLQSAHRDLGQLKNLEMAASTTYPQLNASASLKQLRINLDATPTAKFKQTYALKIQRTAINITGSLDSDPRRCHGSYQNPAGTGIEDVIVEWIQYDKEDLDARLNHVRRIDDLAKMIHSSSDRHPDLHTLDCLGYTDDSSSSRYGLIYISPHPSSSNLNVLIQSNDMRTPDLGDRFKLAHTLAVALWSFHSLDWLHKSLCSSNILFFPSAFSASAKQATAISASIPDISSPFVLGFDASRPDGVDEMSVASKNSAAADLHRHPNSLNGMSKKPYCKGFDIYSLGLILLEIGLWKVLQTYHKPHHSPERFRDKVVVQNLVPNLNSKTGRLYREVVERCLFAKDDLSDQEAGQLMEIVVGSLESLRV